MDLTMILVCLVILENLSFAKASHLLALP
jgi:hypothetical protein